MFQQLAGVMRNTDGEVLIQPYITEKTLGKLSTPAKPIDERRKQFPRNSWTVGDFIEGTFHASGQSSIVQCCISTKLKPEDFVTEINKLGDELDKEDKWMMTLHPIQIMETTNLAFPQGTTRCADVTQLGKAINEKLNKLQSTTNKTYIHVKSQNIFINTEERQLNWNKPGEAHPYTPANHIICAVENYHTLLPLVLQIYNPSKKSGFPLEIKYALIVMSDTKSFRGNRIEVEATVRIAQENQYAFLNDVRSVTLHDVILGNPHTPLHNKFTRSIDTLCSHKPERNTTRIWSISRTRQRQSTPKHFSSNIRGPQPSPSNGHRQRIGSSTWTQTRRNHMERLHQTV